MARASSARIWRWKGDAARVGNAAGFVRIIKIAATILADLNDGMVVLSRDLRDEVIDAARPNLQARFGQRTFGRHLDVDLCKRIASWTSLPSPSVSVPKWPVLPD